MKRATNNYVNGGTGVNKEYFCAFASAFYLCPWVFWYLTSFNTLVHWENKTQNSKLSKEDDNYTNLATTDLFISCES